MGTMFNIICSSFIFQNQLKDYDIQDYNLACCLIGMSHQVYLVKGRTQAESASEEGAEEGV